MTEEKKEVVMIRKQIKRYLMKNVGSFGDNT